MCYKTSKSSAVVILSLLCGLLLAATPVLAGELDALFEVRLGVGESDAHLAVGETLNLEVWLTLGDDQAGAPSSYVVQAHSFFLDLEPIENNIISFNSDYIDDSGYGSTYINGSDNVPVTGEFSRSFLGSAMFDNSVPKRIGRFSVSAQGEGSVDYSFGDEYPFREWVVSIDGIGEPDHYYPIPGTPAITIDVIPEPTTLFLLMPGLLACRCRRLKYKRRYGA